MIRQPLVSHRTIPLLHAGLLIFLLKLSLIPPFALAAGAPGGSSGGSSGSTSSAAQAPPIPLELKFFASCTRTHPDSRPVHPECIQAGNPAPIPGSWTARENCELSLAYNQERWHDVRKIIQSFLDDLECKPQKPPENSYYSVVFFNEGLTTPNLSRVIFHRDPKPEIYGNRIGSYDLYDLKLLPDFGIPVTSVYQANTTPNGVIAQLPGVIAKAAGTFANIPTAPSSSSNIVLFSFEQQPQKETPSTFIIHRINSPKAFKRGGLATPSVVPQASVSDQLSFSPSLESYFLASLAARAAQEDTHFGQSPGAIISINQTLADSYKTCRSTTQISVTTDKGSYKVGDAVMLTEQLNPPGNTSSNSSYAQSSVRKIDSASPIFSTCTNKHPILQTREINCNAQQIQSPGIYTIRTDLYGSPSATTSLAKAYTSIVVKSQSSTQRGDALVLSDRMPAFGTALNVNYAFQEKMPTHNPMLEIFRVDNRSGQPSRTTGIDTTSGTKGTIQIDTGDLGPGDWVTVLADDSGATSLAAASFTVSARTPAAQAATNCPLGVPQGLPSSLTGNQEFMQDAVDLSAAYTALFSLSNSGAQPSVQALTTQYTFGKLTHWSFSLGSGGMFPAFHNKSAKVVTSDSSTSLASDLASPSITFVAADYHPVSYDETRFSPTGAERFRFFGGIALTPKAGFVLGLGESLFRGFTLEGGFAALLSDVVPTSTKFGTPVPNVKTHRGFFYAPFLAIGYSFQ